MPRSESPSSFPSSLGLVELGEGRGGQFGGPLYWKLNARILEEQDFIVAYSKLWEEQLKMKEQFHDCADWWDLSVKPASRILCQHYSVLRQQSRRDTADFLVYCLGKAVK
jgi:hypothetical protein